MPRRIVTYHPSKFTSLAAYNSMYSTNDDATTARTVTSSVCRSLSDSSPRRYRNQVSDQQTAHQSAVPVLTLSTPDLIQLKDEKQLDPLSSVVTRRNKSRSSNRSERSRRQGIVFSTESSSSVPQVDAEVKSSRHRMTEKIQKTIRALYDSKSSTKQLEVNVDHSYHPHQSTSGQDSIDSDSLRRQALFNGLR